MILFLTRKHIARFPVRVVSDSSAFCTALLFLNALMKESYITDVLFNNPDVVDKDILPSWKELV